MKKTLITLTATACFTLSGHAALLGTYELADNLFGVSDANGADGITFTDLSINNYSATEIFNNSDVTDGTEDGTVSGFIRVDGSEDSKLVTDAITASNYFSFTLTNTSGSTLQLDSFSVDTRRNNTFQAGISLFSSVEGTDDAVADLISNVGFGNNGTDSTFTTQTFDLQTLSGNGANVQNTDFNIASGASITFYLVNYQNSGGNTRALDLGNFSVSGTVIPEPGTFALFGGLFALGFVMVRRRK